MADSRLTDLPNFTEINDDDVLYIVDISQDTSNKITYRNLVGNKIEALSGTINNLNIPNINQLTTDVATVSVIQLGKAEQSSLNATNARVTTLEGDNTTNKNNIAQNDLDISSLSAYIDQKAPLSAETVFDTKIDALSTVIDAKADITSVQLKTNQVQTDSLSTIVFNLSSQVNENITSIDSVDTDLQNTKTDLNDLESEVQDDLSELNTKTDNLSATVDSLFTPLTYSDYLSSELDSQIDNLDLFASSLTLSGANMSVPFNFVQIASNTSFLTTFNNLTGGINAQPVEPNIIGNTATAYLSSSTLDRYISFEGLITQSVIVSSGSIEFNAYNPTDTTIEFNDVNLMFCVFNAVSNQYILTGGPGT